MDPLGALTPYRYSALLLDINLSSVLQEEGITLRRDGNQIATRATQGMANKDTWQNVRHWSSGCWSLEPLQQDIANLHESDACDTLIITDWNWIQTLGVSGNQDIMQAVPNWAQSTLPGASYGTGVPSAGDMFFRKRIPSTGSADPGALSANADFDSDRPALPYPNSDIPMDRIGVTNDVFPNNAGFFIRWRVPGVNTGAHRYVLAFHFGQYVLVLTGSGEAQLWEYAQPSGDSDPYYIQRDEWRYTQEAHAAPSHAHCMAIFPQVSSDGNRFIAFSNLATASAPKTNTSKKVDSGQSVAGEHHYRITSAVMGTDVDQCPGYATTSDYVRIDVRRDARPDVQISQLGFPVGPEVIGTLVDDPILAPTGNWTGNTAPINQNYGFVTPTGTVCTGNIIDAETGATFIPGTDLYPQATFTLSTTDPLVTPTLWGYHHIQPPVHISYGPGSFALLGQDFNIQGYAGDPQTELATVEANDVSMTHTRLTKRGRFSAAITVNFPPDVAAPSATETVIVFHGVALSPQSEQVGPDLAHPGGSGTGAGTLPTTTYVAPQWRKYSINIVGMYHRLNEHVQPPYPAIYANDPTAPQNESGYDQTWKVTDVIVDVLTRCGFDGSQQNIPDLAVRMWPGYADGASDLIIEPATGLAEWLVRFVRDHLGAYLHFEPNAGATGQWILIFGTQPNDDGTFASPRYNFTGDPAGVSGLANPVSTLSYGTVSGVPTTFYSKIRYAQNPPDYNKITISTAVATADSDTQQLVQQVVANPLSYPVPGMTTAADPDHPDYIGHCIPYEAIVPQLAVGGDGEFDVQATQGNVNWYARRCYNFFCHGQRLAFVDAPLVFVQDGSLSATAASSSGNWRPLRFQDPVMLDGDPTWIIKSVQPYWKSDRAQRCVYELIQPFPGQYFIGLDERDKLKKAHRASIVKHSGMPHSATHSGRTVPAHRHSQYHHLSIAGPIGDPIQNSDGSFVSMSGWNTWDGSAG